MDRSQMIFYGRGHSKIDDVVLELLRKEGLDPVRGNAEIGDFGNTETKVEILDSVRGKGVVFCQDYDVSNLPQSERFERQLSINDLIMEGLIFGEAVKGSKALETYFLFPELPYDTAFCAGLMHSMRGAMWYELREGHSHLVRNDLRDLGDWIHRRKKSSELVPGVVLEPKLYIGSAALDIGQRIARVFSGLNNDKLDVVTGFSEFRDPTKEVRIDQSKLDVKGRDVFYVQNFYQPNGDRSVNDNLMEALLFAYYARKNGAGRLTAVFPNCPYERQDKRQTREPISLKAVAEMLYAAGYDQVLTVSLHCEESEGAFGRLYFDNISADPIIYAMVKGVREGKSEPIGILTTDMGGAELGRDVTRRLKDGGIDVRVAIAGKDRPRAEQVGKTYIVGYENLKYRYICVVDDLIASGGSAMSVVEKAYEMMSHHGFKGASLFFVSGFFNNGALERLAELNRRGVIEGVYGANTIPHDYSGLNASYPFVHTFDISRQIGIAMHEINTHGSISRTLEHVETMDRIV